MSYATLIEVLFVSRMKTKFIYTIIPIVFLGISSLAIAQIQDKKKPDTLKTYAFYSATAYFSGNGQQYVTTQTFVHSDLLAMCKAIDSASKGAIVTIDNLRYIDKNGKTWPVKDVPYDFNKGKIPIPYKSPGELELEKINPINLISGIVYFSGSGFPNVMSINVKDKSLLSNCIARCTTGSIITFENCTYKNQNGVLSTISKSIKL